MIKTSIKKIFFFSLDLYTDNIRIIIFYFNLLQIEIL